MNTENKWPEIISLAEEYLSEKHKEKRKSMLIQMLTQIAQNPASHDYFRKYLSDHDIFTEDEFDKFIQKKNYEPNFQPLYDTHLQRINPALDFVRDQGIAFVTTEIMARIKVPLKYGFTYTKKLIPVLITSKGDILECSDSELKNFGIRARTIPSQALTRWHPKDVGQYVATMKKGLQPVVYLPSIFDEIRAAFVDYAYFASPVIYDFISIYVISTYFYPLFPAFPILVLFGPKQSGKSLNLQLMEHLAFNAMLVTDPTPATIYRAIEEFGPTLLLDEIESLASRKEYAGSFMSILRASYKRIDVPRMEERKDGGYKLRFFQAFGPKAIATIQGVEDVLANRSIIINLVRRRHEDARLYKNTDPALEAKKWRELRNQLYLLVMTRWQELDALITPTMKELENTIANRELELWTPILSIANWIDRNREDRGRTLFIDLLDMALEKSKERKSQDKEANHTILVLQALLELVSPESKPDWHSNLAIREKLEQFYAEPQGWMNETWIGRMMAQIGITKSCRRNAKSEFIGEKKLTHYWLDPAWLRDYCERYGVDVTDWLKGCRLCVE